MTYSVLCEKHFEFKRDVYCSGPEVSGLDISRAKEVGEWEVVGLRDGSRVGGRIAEDSGFIF